MTAPERPSTHLALPAGPPTTAATAATAPVSLAGVAALLRGLDRAQRRAVTHREGPLMVVAGPGTGKTEVITRRVAWLIATKRASPAEVLALTFTDRAADEMQARVDILVPYGHAEAAIHTFHAFGDRLIREFGHELGLPPDPRVISRAEGIVLLREHLFELGLERYLPLADPTRFLGALVDRCARAKDAGLSPEDLRARAEGLAAAAQTEEEADEAVGQRELAVAHQRYQGLLLERGLIDFGDQVAMAVRLLRERPAVRAELQRRFRYVVVDEFQDTNPIQLELLALLAGARANVTVVGDDDQSIYTFRGAAMDNVLDFRSRFPGTRHVVLRRNHRSRAPILEVAQRLIRHNDPYRLEVVEGLDKRLSVTRRARRPEPVRWRAFLTGDEEGDAVATDIASRLEQGAAPSDIGVLVRTNADAGPVLRSLVLRGVPVRFSGASGIYARPEVRELLCFLRAAADPDATVDMYGMATGAPYGLGGQDLTAIVEMARRKHRSLWSVIVELEGQPGLLRVSSETRRRLARLRDDMRAALEDAHVRPAGELLYQHLKRTGRLRELVSAADAGDEAPLRNVARLFELVRAQSALVADDRLVFVARHLQTLTDAGDDPAEPESEADAERVSVLTVHKAKGLEFGVVFMVGLVDGRFPLRGRGDRLPLIGGRTETVEVPFAEERRLCYVAMTRARDELHLSWSRRTAAGRSRRPSPFLAEALDVPLADLTRDPDVGGSEPLLQRLEAGLTTEAPLVAPGAASLVAQRREQTGPLTLSFSQIDDYLTCPLKYRLRHVVRVPTPPHHALVLGNALHQAAAAFHRTQMRGEQMPESELLDVFGTHWSNEGFLSRHHEEARFAAGRAALVRFRETELRPGSSVPAAVERPFSVRIGRDVVRGRYDRLDATPDGVVVTDYKSSDVRDQKKADTKARDSLQLQVYALAHEAETGARPSAVQLHFLDSGVVGRAVPDDTRLDRARATIAQAGGGIRAGDFKARPDYLACGYCPYRAICPEAAA